MWPLSLEEQLLSGIGPRDSGGLLVPSPGHECTMEIGGRLQEESRAVLNRIVLLPLDHSSRSAHLASPASSARQWLPTRAPTLFQFCNLIFSRVSVSQPEVPDELCLADIPAPPLSVLWSSCCLSVGPCKAPKTRALLLL